MASAIQERKEISLVQWKDPVSFLRGHQKLDLTDLFSVFLETFTIVVRRDHSGNDTHTFTILDGDFSPLNESLINNLMKKCLLKAFDSKKVAFGDEEEPAYRIHARLFGVPDKNLGNPTDVASLLQYQKDRVHPSTFMPLDYFSQKDETQGFVSALLEVQMGDFVVPAAEYLCPYTHCSTKEDSVTKFVAEEPTIQVRRMDKRHIGPSLKHIADIFERIVKPAKAYTPETLKRDLALLSYKWTFTSPYEEESGAVVDLMQTTLAALHGYKFQVKNKTKIYDLALAKPYFPTFLQKYNSLVSLTR